VARIGKAKEAAPVDDETAADRIESDMRSLLAERGLSLVDEYVY
jgi:hypothetical protein